MTLKRKILIGIGVWFALRCLLFVFILKHIDELRHPVGVLMHQNYRSVIYCQQTDDALERINNNLLLRLIGEKISDDSFHTEEAKIRKLWKEELGNISVEHEEDLAQKVDKNLQEYLRLLHEVLSKSMTSRQMSLYRQSMMPLYQALIKDISTVLDINQSRMHQADTLAREHSELLFRVGVSWFVLSFLFLAIGGWWLTHCVQAPLHRILSMSAEITHGNYSVATQSLANDEIGQLVRAFNTMASSLRSNQSDWEEKIRNSRQVFNGILMSIPIPLAVFSKDDGTMRLVSEAGKEYFKIASNENVLTHGEHWLRDIFRKACESGKLENADRTVVSKNETTISPFRVIGLPLPLQVPVEEQHVVVVFLQNTSEQLRIQDFEYRLLSGFMDKFKHLIDNILLADYALLNEACGPLTPKQQEVLCAIREDSQHIADSLTQLIRTKQWGVDPRLVEGVCDAREAMELISERFQAGARQSEIEFKLEYEAELPTVRISSFALVKIFEQLIKNAFRFTPPGGTIRLNARRQNDRVEFTVADTGSGIPDELKAKVFEPFFKVNKGDDSHNGLGLSLVKKAVTYLGGNISLHDGEEGGTVICFTLPVADTEIQQEHKKETDLC